MTMLRRTMLFVAMAAAAGGCTKVTMEDDIDLDLDWTPLVGPSSDLHSPYVEGASFGVWAESHNDREKMVNWTVRSSDESVILCTQVIPRDSNGAQIPANGEIHAQCTAKLAGSAQLEVFDDSGSMQYARSVEVKVPDRAAVLAHGPLLLGQPDAAALTESAHVLDGGTATFLVKWYAGDQFLAGHGVLTASAPSGVDAKPIYTSFLEDRDWLQVTAQATPGGAVALSANGHPVTTFPVVDVPASAIARLKISGMDESQAHKDEWLTCWAQAFDAPGASIYGVDFAWDVDGTTQTGMGDLYRYPYEPAQPKSLGATGPNGMTVAAMIHAGQGYVDSTNNVGCSLGGRDRASSLGFALVILAALALSRRRS
jgi:MYXO-CTERM domain-containing protein